MIGKVLMIRLLLTVSVLVALSLPISAIDQQTVTKGYDFQCLYELDENPWEIEELNDLEFGVSLESDDFYSCPEYMKVWLIPQNSYDFSQDQVAEGFTFTCDYSPRNYRDDINIESEPIKIDFSSEEHYECPYLFVYMDHAEEYRMRSVPQVWVDLEPGAQKTYDVESTAIPITEIEFDTRDVPGQRVFDEVQFAVTSYENRPSLVSTPHGTVYGYLRITKEGLPSVNLESADINFFVDKSWIESNNIGEVDLKRYVDDHWEILPTNRRGSSENFVFYSAESPGLGFFAITGMQSSDRNDESLPGNGQDNTPDGQEDNMPGQDTTDNEQNRMPETQDNTMVYVWSAIIAAAIALIVVFFASRKKYEEVPERRQYKRGGK